MPKLLIKLVDHVNPDPAIDQVGAYKRGMVIAVVEDAHILGKQEHYQTFLDSGGAPEDWHGKTALINLTGKSVAAIFNLTDEESNEFIPEQRTVTRRRVWKVDIDNLPAPFLSRLDTEYELTMPAAALNGLVRGITSNAAHTEF